MRVSDGVSDEAVAACASCRQPLTGRYCAQCGEKALDRDALTVRHFLRHAIADELVHFDGKFWRTVRGLLLRPGFLSEEYSSGRRRPYIGPVRLLIAAIVSYALVTQGGLRIMLLVGGVSLSIAPVAMPQSATVEDAVAQIDRFRVLGGLVAARAASVDLRSEAARDSFHRRLTELAQPLSFANVLMLALALYLLFRRRRTLFVEHAVFSMHVVSFVLLSSLAALPGDWLLETNEAATLAIVLGVIAWQFAYLTLAIRRFYFGGTRSARSAWSAAATAMLIYLLNSAFITAIQTLAAAIALQRI